MESRTDFAPRMQSVKQALLHGICSMCFGPIYHAQKAFNDVIYCCTALAEGCAVNFGVGPLTLLPVGLDAAQIAAYNESRLPKAANPGGTGRGGVPAMLTGGGTGSTDHVDGAVARALHNAAVALQEQGRLVEAIAKYKESVRTAERAPGPAHLSVAETRDHMALAFARMGRFECALEELGEALRARTQVLGRGHGQVASTLLNMARVHAERRDWARCAELAGRARALWAATRAAGLPLAGAQQSLPSSRPCGDIARAAGAVLLRARAETLVAGCELHGDAALGTPIMGGAGAVDSEVAARALVIASSRGNTRVLRTLLGAGVAAGGDAGVPALIAACAHGRTAAATLLVDAGARINGEDGRGQTPLIWASAGGHLSTVRLLLARYGCDVQHRCSQGRDALSWASANGRPEQRSEIEAVLRAVFRARGINRLAWVSPSSTGPAVRGDGDGDSQRPWRRSWR